MRISIFGLGYVGCVSAACLAKEGHDVVGVDVSQMKVDMINHGHSPIVEKDLDTILEEVISRRHNGSLIATTDPIRAVADTEISLICVGTPSQVNGNLNLDAVIRCAGQIGAGLKEKSGRHVVVVRSTMLPGSLHHHVLPEIEYRSGRRAGRDFGAAINPEFLRESTSIHDFYNPPVTVIGQLDEASGDVVSRMYEFLNAPVVRTDIRTAEMIKYANNAFHALKVAFGNEIGAICKAIGIDSHQVMNIFCMDTKLNLSPYYLKPGFAFGGSCLPKDLRALDYLAKQKDVAVPLLRSISESNRIHLQRAIQFLIQTGKRKIGILGLSFKAGTDDLRESPLVTLTETLLGKGFDIKIYDKNVSIAKLFGANKEYIEKEIPHIGFLMCETIEEVLSHAEVIVIGNKTKEFLEIMGKVPDKIVYDLVRIMKEPNTTLKGYEGICW